MDIASVVAVSKGLERLALEVVLFELEHLDGGMARRRGFLVSRACRTVMGECGVASERAGLAAGVREAVDGAIDVAIREGLVRADDGLLTWVGPELPIGRGERAGDRVTDLVQVAVLGMLLTALAMFFVRLIF